MTLTGLNEAPLQLFDELARLLRAVALETPDHGGALSEVAALVESAKERLRDGETDHGASASSDADPSGGDTVVVAKSAANICDSPEIMAIYRRGVARIVRRLAFEQTDLALAQVLHTVVQRFENGEPTTRESC